MRPEDSDEPALPFGLTDSEREQINLTATYFNGIAIGLVLVGGLTIPATIILRFASNEGFLFAFMLCVACAGASAYIHDVAKRKLRGLDR